MAIDETSFAHVVDRLAIEAVLVRYAAFIDTKQFDGLCEVFSADAVVDYTSAGGIKGSLAEVSTWRATVLAPSPSCSTWSRISRSRSTAIVRAASATSTTRWGCPVPTHRLDLLVRRALHRRARAHARGLAYLPSRRRGAVHARAADPLTLISSRLSSPRGKRTAEASREASAGRVSLPFRLRRICRTFAAWIQPPSSNSLISTSSNSTARMPAPPMAAWCMKRAASSSSCRGIASRRLHRRDADGPHRGG